MIAQNPIVGRSRNKLANTIFSTWNGLNIVRSKPLSVANPKSLAQRIQRARTTVNAQFAKAFSAAILIGFRIKLVGQSARSQALKANYPATYADPVTAVGGLTFANAVVSKGSMTPTPITTATANSGSLLVGVTFPTTVADASQAIKDKMVLCVFNGNTGASVQSIANVDRSGGSITASLPEAVQSGDEVHFYLFAYSVTTSAVSDSSYELDIA